MKTGRSHTRGAVIAATALLAAAAVTFGAEPAVAADPCVPLLNPIACENSKPGTPQSTWDVSGAGSSSIQGFATQMSVDVGETQSFKVKTTATSYRLDIYRMGYYGGNGARLVGSVTRNGAQSQPNCLSQASTGLVDCGNWAVSASWTVPATAVSGIYFARLVRTDGTSGASHVFFVVRDDSGHADMVFQTSDTTWQAYNSYGGNSLYTGSPAGRAYKVSYNRPFGTRGSGDEDFVFNAEYPMVRFLESNGYDVSYIAGVDTDRRGALLRNHKVFLSVGHDEYWSGTQRANVEAARDAGVHLAFFSGNEVFWKTRWEPSADGSGTAYRTLVCYKETHANSRIDPLAPSTWTGTWRDPRFSPPGDGGRPENALTGTIFKVNAGTVNLQVPAADGKMRFWRGTTVATQAAGATATLGTGTVGYEWDVDADNGARPRGLIRLSTTTASGLDVLQDYGSTYASGSATHNLTLYRAPSGALVFGAGTVQWSWGLDSNHDRGSGAPSTPMRQATVNLFADMGVQPATLVAGLTAATASTDTTGPSTTITAPVAGSAVESGAPATISGTANDSGGGVVGGVEVSTDGGATWHPATGRATWSYTWTPGTTGPVTLRVRATDDSGNVGADGAVPVTVGARSCPCSLWSTATVPATPADPDSSATEIGVKFRSDTAGQVTALRFYKSSANTGTHVGHLWTASGALLATVTFTGETASGWQQATLSPPVTLAADTTYVASYYAPNGRYAGDVGYFASSGRDAAPLHAPRDGAEGPNGVYRMGTGFPTLAWESANYYVDVVFTPSGGAPDTTPPTVTGRTPASGATGVATSATVTATFSEAVRGGTVAMTLREPGGATVPGAVSYDDSTRRATFTPAAALAASTTYTANVSGAADPSGNTMAPVSWSFTTAATTPPPSGCPCSIWSTSTTPGTTSDPDTDAVEVGTKFRSDVAGQVTGVRFYKGAGNTGTHVGHLWTRTGTLLASVTFSGESASGWQQATFATPVSIAANTTYVVSYYAPNGRYAADADDFAATGVDNAPLHALRDGVDGANGVYRYGTGGGFPTSTWRSANYWVDVAFDTSAADTTPPAVTATNPAANATGVPAGTAVSATLSEAIVAGTASLALTAGGNPVAGSTAYDAASRTVTFTPSAALAVSTSYTARVSGVRDPSGNTMAPFSWSFTTAAATSGCPCTIWPNTATPAEVTVDDDSAVELGVKFRANQAGFVTGLRFYKGPSNTGTHVGSLWSSGGTRLGTVTFSGESASGWQTATLPAPVAVNANTTYVASYHTTVGFYSATGDGLASAVTRGPLTALASGAAGGNGVYAYGAGGFPTDTFQASNYWVDVVFNQTAVDGTPPTVTGRAPAPGASGVATTSRVTATFSEAVTASSVVMTLNGPGGATVTGSTVYDSATSTATFTPAAALANSTAYTAGVSGARDAAGNVMSPVTWSFTTAAPAPPPPDQGPGGPVLIIKNGAGFTGFAAEVLRTEGINEFATAELSTVTSAVLNQYDVVLLGATPLTAAQVLMFGNWVTGGGNLIAFRPDKQLATLLGLVSTTGTLANGYLKVDTATAPGAGITDQTIQFHGTADRYTLAGARAVATLYSSATAATTNPAVTLVSVGPSGGQAAAFTYDLPQSLVQTRQGNPAWDGQERDGTAPIRPNDLFFGGSSTDWVNLDKAAIPQADEQQRLLANLIGTMNLDRKPLPRFWYFPRSLKAVVVATGDDHGHGGTVGRFDQYLANSPAGCVVASWQCPRFTSYVYASTPLSNGQAASYNTSGFEVGLHVSTDCQDYTASSIASTYSTQLSQWRQKYTSLPSPATSRTHCIVWSDWSSQASTARANGIRLDTNYYYWPGSWIADRPGFMTGSGMPMRFADKSGALIDVYQATTQMTDESDQSYPFTPDTLLDRALGPLGYYGAFTANMHTDDATTFPSDQLLASAQARNVPIISARQLLTWLDGRNGSSFSGISRSGNTLAFTVDVGAGANGLTGMVPTAGTGGTTLSTLTLGGNPVSFTRTTIKGVEYAMFLAAPGAYTATYASAAAARTAPVAPKAAPVPVAPPAPAAVPKVSGVEVSPLPDGTAGVAWQTSTKTSGTLLLGSTPDTLRPLSASGTRTSHIVVATRLRPDATYYYRVLSTDAAGRAVVWPAEGQPPARFVSSPPGVADRSAAQFRAGRGGAGTSVRPDGVGALALAPGTRAGSRVSRVLDAGQMVTWDRLTYGATVPIGCSLRVSVRTGSTSTPDASWSAWTPVGQGGRVEASSRYLQYRVELTAVRAGRTPALRWLGVTSNATYAPPPGELGQ